MKNTLLVSLIILGFTACKKVNNAQQPFVTKTHHILLLGNSITYTAADPSVGWTGNWGMAASAADSDYVHLLTARLKKANSASTLAIVNEIEFEVNFDTYDFDKNLKSYRDAKPDIIILRIGEDVTRTADSVLFEKRYVDLLNYLKVNNPDVKILAAGSVWRDRDLANRVMAKYSDYISLVSLSNDNTNFAFGLFPNLGVQSHPDNKGMRSISDQIWAALQKDL